MWTTSPALGQRDDRRSLEFENPRYCLQAASLRADGVIIYWHGSCETGARSSDVIKII